METTLLAAQALTTSLIAAWLTLGARDNLLHPSVNETYTAEVMEMARMREDYPDTFAQVAHRAITNRATQQLAFRVVVAVEVSTTLVLWAGVKSQGLCGAVRSSRPCAVQKPIACDDGQQVIHRRLYRL